MLFQLVISVNSAFAVKIGDKMAKNTIKKMGTNMAAIYVLAIIAIGLLAFNQYQISSIGGSGASATGAVVSTGDPVQDAVNAVIPTGKPDVYGDELEVTFDKPQESLNILAALESQISFDSLTSVQQDRYHNVGSHPTTSCGFCCGRSNIGFAIGRGGIVADSEQCGCAHNKGFSGLTKYLLKNHENEFTDEQIIAEIQKWKGLFFPKQMIAKYLQAQAEQGKLSDTSVLSQLPGMVGGC